MAEPCGCKVDHRRGAAQEGRFIAYCRMHAAAGDILAALERIERKCRWGHESINEAWDDLHAIVAIARKAIAAARGGAA